MRRTLRIRSAAIERLERRYPNKTLLADKLGISRATYYRHSSSTPASVEVGTAFIAGLWEYFKGELEFDEIFEVVPYRAVEPNMEAA